MNEKNWLLAYENYSFFKHLENAKRRAGDREIIFLCVGNSKVWFDSFGPLLGTLLGHLNLEKYIYGNTRANIKSSNIREYIEVINRFHIDPFIIVVDNALSKEHFGLCVKEGPTTCGALSNDPVTVGDLSITFSLDKAAISNPKTYLLMFKELKRIARFIYYVFKRS